jgi:hypothetical protein
MGEGSLGGRAEESGHNGGIVHDLLDKGSRSQRENV